MIHTRVPSLFRFSANSTCNECGNLVSKSMSLALAFFLGDLSLCWAPKFWVLRQCAFAGVSLIMARSSSDGFSQHRGSSSSRAGKLLGYSSSSYNAVHDTDAVSELNEEDVWDLGNDGSSDTNRAESSDTYGYVNPGRRWMGIDNKEPGLSAAFAENTRPYGLSPHKLVGGYANSSRDGRSTAVRMIPPIAQIRENSPRPMMHQSAPVNVPDWSKILGAERKNKWADDLDSDKEDAEEERLPPHLQIQREYAQSTTFSVCEGAGRTLKGRDLSRVRNAVLRQTGFFDGWCSGNSATVFLEVAARNHFSVAIVKWIAVYQLKLVVVLSFLCSLGCCTSGFKGFEKEEKTYAPVGLGWGSLFGLVMYILTSSTCKVCEGVYFHGKAWICVSESALSTFSFSWSHFLVWWAVE